MGRKVERLTVDHLPELPGGCGSCVFWELDPVRRLRVGDRAAEEKAAWVSMVLRDWGSCGRVLRVDDELVGHIMWAPPSLVPGSAGFATAPVSTDAVLLTTAYVEPAHRGGGLGRVLVQAMAKDLIKRGGIRAVEAFGNTRPREGSCVLPADYLLAVGFSTHRAHPLHPRMRMDLRSTVKIREELEKGLSKLLAPVKRPAPVKGATGRALRDRSLPGEPVQRPAKAPAHGPEKDPLISLTWSTPVELSTSGGR